MALDGQIIDHDARRGITTCQFDVETVLLAADAGTVAQSFGDATDTLSIQLAAWFASVVQSRSRGAATA